MNVEPIGIAILVLCLLMLRLPLRAGTAVFAFATLLGASAAVTLPALGNANVSPAHLMLAFFCLAAFARGGKAARRLECLDIGAPGFWLLATAVWCLISAYLMPRLFAGQTSVYTAERVVNSLGRTMAGIALHPLAPSSGNLTQSLYFVGDFLCFTAACVIVRTPKGMAALGGALLLAGVGNIAFGALDLATYWTGTAEVLGFMRNTTYRLLEDSEMAGIKRIVGSFTEASAFAGTTVSFLVFSLQLWRLGVSQWLTGPLALASAVALALATSSTGYAAIGAYSVILYFSCAREAARGPVSNGTMAILIGGPILAVVVACAVAANESVLASVMGILDKTMSAEKLASDSGIERALWNAQAITNFLDSYGLGIGIGSTRASSLATITLASFGVVGTATFLLFLRGVFAGGGRIATVGDARRYAARQTCLAMLMAGLISGGQVDPGLPFFLFAALACSPAGRVGAWPRGTRPAPRRHAAASLKLAGANE